MLKSILRVNIKEEQASCHRQTNMVSVSPVTVITDIKHLPSSMEAKGQKREQRRRQFRN